MENDKAGRLPEINLVPTQEEIDQMNDLYNMLGQVCIGYSQSMVTQVVTNILADVAVNYSGGDPDLILNFSLNFNFHIAKCIAGKVASLHADKTEPTTGD